MAIANILHTFYLWSMQYGCKFATVCDRNGYRPPLFIIGSKFFLYTQLSATCKQSLTAKHVYKTVLYKAHHENLHLWLPFTRKFQNILMFHFFASPEIHSYINKEDTIASYYCQYPQYLHVQSSFIHCPQEHSSHCLSVSGSSRYIPKHTQHSSTLMVEFMSFSCCFHLGRKLFSLPLPHELLFSPILTDFSCSFQPSLFPFQFFPFPS